MKKERNCQEPMEVFSRVVGYYRPVQNWNKGKQCEFNMRKTYKMNKAKKQLEVEEARSIFAI